MRRFVVHPPPTVYYFVPDFDQPSWGNGLLYHHVRLLRQNGIGAAVVHERAPFRLSWLDAEVPVTYLSDGFRPRSRDVLVVSELRANDAALRAARCRRLVFVQGSFLILRHLPPPYDYRALGFEHALTTLPHLKAILERHHGAQATLVPPFVAPYFFLEREALHTVPRARRVLLVAKAGYQQAGYPDLDIVARLLARRQARAVEAEPWAILALKDKSHPEVAALMQASAFLVNVNCLEGFNATVPEAMAAGCLPVCYDAFGGRDYLRDGENAFVFPNNHAYPLLEKLCALMDRYEALQKPLAQMREQAHATACQYTEAHTEAALIAFFRAFLS